jgi:protein phosphatase
MRLTAGGRSDSGPRALNQDTVHWDLDLGLFVVADGMGGHNGGEVASRLAVEAIRNFVSRTAATTDIQWPFPIESGRSLNVNRLMTAVRIANRRVYGAGTADAALEGMGTTVVALLADREPAALVGVGDSRIYRWRAGAVEQLTSDDTWLAAVLGQADADRAHATHPLRHVLTSVVGTRHDISPSAREETLRAGDRWVLCSDGVHGRVDASALALILSGTGSPAEMASSLVEAALARHTTDNASAVVIAVD